MFGRLATCVAAGSALALMMVAPAGAKSGPTTDVTSAAAGGSCTIDVQASVSDVHGPNYVVQFYGYQGLYVQAFSGSYPVPKTTADPETVSGTLTLGSGKTVESVKALLQRQIHGGGLAIVDWSDAYTLSGPLSCP